MKTDIISENCGDYSVTLLLREGVLWDIAIRHSHFPYDYGDAVSGRISRVDVSQKAAFVDCGDFEALYYYTAPVQTGDTINGYIAKCMDDDGKNPVIKQGSAPFPKDPVERFQTYYADLNPTLRQDKGLMDSLDLWSQIESLGDKNVPLGEAGSLNIEKTAALWAIDVNKGNEASPSKANFKAAREVARHCILRGLTGLIVVDFLRTDQKKDVENKVKDSFAFYPEQPSFYGFSRAGLYEFSRPHGARPINSYLPLIF